MVSNSFIGLLAHTHYGIPISYAEEFKWYKKDRRGETPTQITLLLLLIMGSVFPTLWNPVPTNGHKRGKGKQKNIKQHFAHCFTALSSLQFLTLGVLRDSVRAFQKVN